ncbi:hypothetical protein PGT21_005042 [Puccinia graminis f. sp. tritici]|uniref:Uncharacterized protein n=1 Tax=Puccinia graminis f. sp. tritici TaxID=56615 RepID=A0A5B0QYI9_PUCGR|nr:hypothetical protein PGT21_005042 [Puccinia graminis f. sp. tritici]KAA1118358.1 hypothetical protein PGTUg99_005937 [Puccinia graminis f. sp. tritici]
MSATTLTQTAIKTQWVTTGYRHQPLLVSTPCIIPPPTAEQKRKAPPVRCSARLISQSSSPSIPPAAAPTTPRSKRRRASTKNTRVCPNPHTDQLGLSGGSTAFGDSGTHSVLLDRPQPSTHPAPGSPLQQKPFPSLQPLQAVPPIADKLSPPLPSLSFTFLPAPHLGKPSILSFPKTPIPSDLVFHFPQSVPARHLPPPHPSTRHLISLPSHSQSHQDHHRLTPHQSVSYRSQPLPTWSAAPQPHLTRSKRRLALPEAHHVRSKKLKLHHSFFRSPQVLYPVDYSLRTTAPSAMSSPSKTIQNPKWLHTSAAAEGQPSKMRPHEAQCTGNPENWGPMPNNRRSFSPRSPLNSSPLSKTSPPAKSHRSSPPASTGGSQAAPLKAQLMAVLRMHSNLQPGEAALRLKKWVIWNSWVRGRAQMRFYPIVSPNPPNPRIMAPSPSRAARPASSSARDGWTGNEVFDDNGDLICEEEEVKHQKKAEQKNQSSRSSTRQAVERAPLPATRTESPSPRKSRTIIKLKIPSRNSTPRQYPLQPTPPDSPVSPSHPQHAQKNKSPLQSPDQSVTPTATHRPLTPPPSPPN